MSIIGTMSFIRRKKQNGQVYLSEVENVRINGKVVQKHIRYIGKEADGKTILTTSISEAQVESVKVHGSLLALHHLSKEIGLFELLGSHSDQILSLVFAHCHNYKSINEMSKWFERTDLNMLLDIEKLTERSLLEALDSLEEGNLEELQRAIFEKVQKKYKLKGEGVVYDVTNTYLYGKKCPLGKKGKDKEGVRGRRLIQIGLAVTKGEGVPIFHKTFPGNTTDSKTLWDLLATCRDCDIPSGIFIFDRGVTSSNNIKELKKQGWDVICGMQSSSPLKQKAKEVIASGKLVNIANRVKVTKTTLYVHRREYMHKGIKGLLLICYNENTKKDLRESRYDELLEAEKRIQQGDSIKSQLEPFFTNANKMNLKKVEQAEELDGFSFIFSTKKYSSNEILRLYYKDKDIAEKAFRSLKGIVKIQPIRHWLYNRVVAHVFICYLAYLLLSLLKIKLRKLEISPVQALAELDSLYRVYLKDKKRDFNIARTVTLSKRQEDILKSIDKKLFVRCSG